VADCENAATYFYSCSCGAKGTTTFTNGVANGHSYTVKSTDSKYFDKAADCENAATYFYSCSCGAKGTTTFTNGVANGHSYTVKSTDNKYLDKVADCENAATYFYSCSCGAKGTTTFTNGVANGHSYVIQNVDSKYEKTPASEYTPAVYWKSCACGKASTTETFTHGDMLPGYLTYQLSNDSSFYIVTGFVGAEENISIPHIYDALPVFGIMANAFKNNTTLKSISMPNSIQEIGSYAFAGCTALESVSIPTSVKSIFSYTFSGCTSLKTITLHSGIEELGAFAFENCTALKSITLNEGLKTISNNVFDNCSSLEGITIPDTVTALGNMAFTDAISLKYVNFSKALASIGNATFENCISLESVELHENITTLGSSTFSNCRELKTLRILGDLKSIGIATFYDCVNLESIYFASKAKGNIGNTNYIFYNAGINGDGITLTVAKDAIIPEGIFEPFKEDNAPKITKITIEEDSTSFTSFRVYNYLPYLIEIEIPETVLEFDYGIFNNSLWWNKLTDGAVYIDHIFYGIKGETPKVLEIASDTLCIARGALKGHTNITELNIPDSVTYIGSEAFSGCSSLESITLPFVGGSKSTTSASSSTLFGYIFGTSSYTGGVATEQYYSSSSSSYSTYYIPSSLKSVTVTGGNILYGAFSGCTGLTRVTIGDSVTSIGSYAFSGCSSLESITLPFVGDSRKTASDTYQYPFGYIFGTSSDTGGVATRQYYYGSSTSSETYATYYIPSSLNSVTITGGNILYGAFYNCSKLTSVVIPDSVTSIGSSAFFNCDSLTSVTIGDSVESIGSYAFCECDSLTSVVIPDSVTSIGSDTFYGCDSLTSVTIPDSVTSIGSYAFYRCTSLTSIKYRGTQSQWNSISKGSSWNSNTGNYTITYNYEGE
ncbi:MAG: leucine-rich repeat domain-containing protein, partial [Clostridia bacterium]|nr:leucine-rich repeat domain-containing protein [Clostridia bacterium]